MKPWTSRSKSRIRWTWWTQFVVSLECPGLRIKCTMDKQKLMFLTTHSKHWAHLLEVDLSPAGLASQLFLGKYLGHVSYYLCFLFILQTSQTHGETGCSDVTFKGHRRPANQVQPTVSLLQSVYNSLCTEFSHYSFPPCTKDFTYKQVIY